MPHIHGRSSFWLNMIAWLSFALFLIVWYSSISRPTSRIAYVSLISISQSLVSSVEKSRRIEHYLISIKFHLFCVWHIQLTLGKQLAFSWHWHIAYGGGLEMGEEIVHYEFKEYIKYSHFWKIRMKSTRKIEVQINIRSSIQRIKKNNSELDSLAARTCKIEHFQLVLYSCINVPIYMAWSVSCLDNMKNDIHFALLIFIIRS